MLLIGHENSYCAEMYLIGQEKQTTSIDGG